MNCSCIQASDVNLTLERTFKFIQENQLSPNGYFIQTTVYLKLNLTNSQYAGDPSIRKSASNTVTGYISSVNKTNVVIIAPTSCDDINSEYTVEYSKIIEVVSNSISYYFKQYELALKTLPRICVEKDNQYTDILISLKETIEKYKDRKDIFVQLIFDGVRSRNFYFSEIDVIKNLVIFGEIFIIPLTFVGGYAILPECSTEDKAKG